MIADHVTGVVEFDPVGGRVGGTWAPAVTGVDSQSTLLSAATAAASVQGGGAVTLSSCVVTYALLS